MPVPVAPGRWPLLGHTPALLRHRAKFTSSLRDHGEIVRVFLGPLQAFYVTTPALTYRVLVTDGASFRKGALFDKFQPYLGNGLLLSNGEFHRRQRRMIQPAFHRDRIAKYAETMARTAAEFTTRWQPGEVRRIDDDAQELATTIVGKALFSTEIGERAIAEARRSIYVIIKQGMVKALSPSFVEKLPVHGKFDEAVARMRAVVLEVIEHWRADGVDHGDLLSMLLMAQDEDTGTGLTDQQTYDEVLTMLTGAIETTAIALAWAFHEIARNPDIERRVHAEVDAVLAGRHVTADDVPKLGYTTQVVQEALRMYPVWILMRRAIEDVDLDGERIPHGSEVIISPHAMHYDPHHFPEPERFDPDRWAPGHEKDLPRGAFIPFGAGTRQCIGNTFAVHELVITVATVAARWRLVPVAGKPVRVKFTSAPYPGPMPMTAVPRKQ